MRDASVLRLARLIDDDLIRLDTAGQLKVRVVIADDDRRWVHTHRDSIVAALTPYTPDDAVARVYAVFPGTTVEPS